MIQKTLLLLALGLLSVSCGWNDLKIGSLPENFPGKEIIDNLKLKMSQKQSGGMGGGMGGMAGMGMGDEAPPSSSPSASPAPPSSSPSASPLPDLGCGVGNGPRDPESLCCAEQSPNAVLIDVSVSPVVKKQGFESGNYTFESCGGNEVYGAVPLFQRLDPNPVRPLCLPEAPFQVKIFGGSFERSVGVASEGSPDAFLLGSQNSSPIGSVGCLPPCAAGEMQLGVFFQVMPESVVGPTSFMDCDGSVVYMIDLPVGSYGSAATFCAPAVGGKIFLGAASYGVLFDMSTGSGIDEFGGDAGELLDACQE